MTENHIPVSKREEAVAMGLMTPLSCVEPLQLQLCTTEVEPSAAASHLRVL